MILDDLIHLKFPTGKFVDPGKLNLEQIKKHISDIEILPSQIEDEYKKIKSNGLIEVAYRPGGWTARQVVHHLADSHMNALIRFKMTLTEEHPTIKPYLEARWAELSDSRELDPQISIDLLKGIHLKLVSIMRNASESDFERVYFHPESQKVFKLSTATALYSWHGQHHLGHLKTINNLTTTK